DGAKERILVEAEQLLTERGLADLSLSELGRRLGTSAGHLSYYVGNKDGLLLELLSWREAAEADQRVVILGSDLPPIEKLQQLCQTYLPRHAGDPRWLVWAELWPRAGREPTLKAAQAEYDGAWAADMAELLAALGLDEPQHLTRGLLAMLDGLSISLLIGDEDIDRDAVWDHVRQYLRLTD
ncbi:TetR/AcrR family transcriptional regulator, partial [Nocardioides sp.]|uniref:TetR/AcrR family transcriptional regulator n=1 Tax=Nocardioides sp. TaxID=35761 RepID=UPI0027370FBC